MARKQYFEIKENVISRKYCNIILLLNKWKVIKWILQYLFYMELLKNFIKEQNIWEIQI